MTARHGRACIVVKFWVRKCVIVFWCGAHKRRCCELSGVVGVLRSRTYVLCAWLHLFCSRVIALCGYCVCVVVVGVGGWCWACGCPGLGGQVL